MNKNLYREINGVSYIAPNAETNEQRRNFAGMAGLIVGVALAWLVCSYIIK